MAFTAHKTTPPNFLAPLYVVLLEYITFCQLLHIDLAFLVLQIVGFYCIPKKISIFAKRIKANGSQKPICFYKRYSNRKEKSTKKIGVPYLRVPLILFILQNLNIGFDDCYIITNAINLYLILFNDLAETIIDTLL